MTVCIAALILSVAFDIPIADTPWSCAAIEINHWPRPGGGEFVSPIFRGADGQIRDYWWCDGPWRVGRHRDGAEFVGWHNSKGVIRITAGRWFSTYSGADMEAWEGLHVLPRSQRNGLGIHSSPKPRK